MSNDTVIVQIMGKEYQVACPAGQQDALRHSASYLDEQMNNIRRHGKVLGLERIAVMAALNITHELLQSDDSNTTASKSQIDEFNRLNNKLDDALHRFSQLEIS